MPIPQWWVREKFGIPEAADGEPVLGAPAAAQDAPAAQAVHTLHATRCGCAGCSAHAQGGQTDAPDAPDIPSAQADRMELEAEAAWTAIMDRVRQIVEGAESLPALRDALLAAFADLPDGQLADVMAMGFAAAELAGRFAARLESE